MQKLLNIDLVITSSGVTGNDKPSILLRNLKSNSLALWSAPGSGFFFSEGGESNASESA
jgi:hypothetical protein